MMSAVYLFIFLFICNTSSNFRSIDCRVVAYVRENTNEHFKRLALKVVAGAHERCFLTRGSKFSALSRSLLVFGKTGR